MMRARRGQFLLLAVMLLCVFSMGLSLVLYRCTMTKVALVYVPLKENILSITSDLDRALAHSLSLASQEYYLTCSRESAREQGRAFISTWVRSVLLAYSNLGLEMKMDPIDEGYTDVMFVFDWNEGVGISYVSSRFRLNITSYGFTGWVGDRVRATVLSVDLDSIETNATSGSTRVDFTMTREMNGVVSDLGVDDISILAHVSGGLWVSATNVILEYRGGGNYTVTFVPRVNENTRGIVIIVKTPEDGVVVSAYHRSEEQVQVGVRSFEVDGASQDYGEVQVGDVIIHTLPNMTTTYPGQYIVRYYPNTGYQFVNWTTAGGVLVANATSPLTSVVLTGNGNLTAFYTVGSELPGEDNGSAQIHLESVESTYQSSNLGWISFASVNYFLPQNLSGEPFGYNSLEYTAFDADHLFLHWESEGDVLVENGTSYSTRVYVNGNGTVRAVYLYLGGKASPDFPSGAWDILCVDNEYSLMPLYMWSGDDGKLSPTFNMGNNKQAMNISSPATPALRISEHVNMTCVVRPNPPSRVKDVTLQLGFISNGIYYLLGQETFPIVAEGSYRMPLDTTSSQFPGENGVIPENSTIILTVAVTFKPGGWGTFFLYHGTTWPSSIELGGVPLSSEN